MHPPIRHRLRSPVVLLALSLLATGCSSAPLDQTGDDAPASSETKTAEQSLGESRMPFLYGAEDARPLPSYHERLALHLLNRYRMDPAKYEIYKPMTKIPYDPEPPLIYSPGASETGHWQGRHALENGCFCPKSPMQQPAAFNSCCEIARSNGRAYCASEIVACDSKRATKEEERWRLLNTGGATISRETYFKQQLPPDKAPAALPGDLIADALHGSGSFVAAGGFNAMGLAQTRAKVTPEECRPPTDPCEKGTCTNPATGRNTCDKQKNPECSGICKGPACNGTCKTEQSETGEKIPVSCKLPEPPDPEKCKPEKYPVGFYVSVAQASTTRPKPTLYGGIHMKLGYTSLGEKPVERFGTTPPKKLDYAAYYYHPRGAAQRATVVVDGTCHSMSVQKTGPGGTASGSAPASPDTATSDAAATDGSNADADGGATDTSSGSDAGTGGAYVGVRYGTRTDTSTGCHRYFFSFVDSDGFTHRYPEYGTLGAKIVETQDDQGNTIYLVDSNDESCPVWSPKSVGQSCLPQGDQCVDGETRSCYTGKPNTRGKGICTRGTERCENGHWSGTCEGETTPKPAETCGNGKDDNCNGHADEGCDDGSESPDAGSDGGVAPAPDVSTDAGVRYTGGGGNGGGGCSTPGGPPAAPAPLALIALAGLARSRRRFE